MQANTDGSAELLGASRLGEATLDRQGLIAAAAAPMVTYVIPCRNEADNIDPLVARLLAAADPLLDQRGKGRNELASVIEILFVDDSEDDTPGVVRKLKAEGLPVDVLHREVGNRPGGMSGALAAGFAQARGTVICVLDSDLQHPPELTPELILPIARGDAEIAIASRYIPGGSAAGLGGRWRLAASVGSRMIMHVLIPRTRKLTDPGGNFFAFQRTLLEGVDLRPQGFKMLMEILAKTSWTNSTEVPYVFENRNAGTTSFSAREVWRFFQHLGRLSTPAARLGVRRDRRRRPDTAEVG
jgi:glycosyltransferase involved in cell wall biosynthesis